MSKPVATHRHYAAMVFVIALLFVCSGSAWGEKDPHRPVCATASCKAVKRFVKSHYCGESPFGNGPADGCDITLKKTKLLSTSPVDFTCTWNQQKQTSTCKQVGQVSPAVLQSFRKELHRIGLPASSDKDVLYRVRKSGELSVIQAYYSRSKGSDLWLCQAIAVFVDPSQLQVIRRVRYQKTYIDVPAVVTWSPIDIADVNGDGKQEIVLEGDAYEDHWFEVLELEPDLSVTLLFSGLGYYL